MKKLLIALGLLALLLLGLALFIGAKLDPETLGREVIRRVNAQGELQVEAQSFSLDLRRGLELVDAKVRTADGGTSASVERLVLEHELRPLLSGRVVVRQLVLEKPRIEVLTGPGEEPGEAAAPAPDEAPPGEPSPTAGKDVEGLRLEIATIRIEGGEYSERLVGKDQPELALRGLDLELRDVRFDPAAESALLGFRASGEIRAAEVSTPDIAGRDAGGGIEIDGGHVRLKDVGFATEAGRLVVRDFDADLAQEIYPYQLALGGEMSLDTVLGVAGGDGFGPLTLELEAGGSGPETALLAGAGTLRLAAGTIPASKLSERIEQILGKPLLAGNLYEAADIVFRLSDNRLRIEPFELVAQNLKLAMSGWADMAGPVELRLQVKVPGEGIEIKEIPKELMAGLTDEEGFTTFPMEIAGTLDAPQVQLDRDELKRAAKEGAKEAVREELGGLLRRTLEKRRESDKDG